MTNVLTNEGLVGIWQGTPKNAVSPNGVMLDLARCPRLERCMHGVREGMDRKENGHSCWLTDKIADQTTMALLLSGQRTHPG